MATTKTLTPTNQAITIAAFTEKPDNRVNVTNDDKLADAVNALNSKLNHSGSVALVYRQGTYTDGIEAQSLRWVRSGNLVQVAGEFKLTGTPDASHLYAIFEGLPFTPKFVISIGNGRVSNSAKQINGVRITQLGYKWISFYFSCTDGTYPSAGNVIEITLTYFTDDD